MAVSSLCWCPVKPTTRFRGRPASVAQVAGPEPAVEEGLGIRVGVVLVAREDVLAADADHPGLARGQRAALLREDRDVATAARAGRSELASRGREPHRRDERGGLGHAERLHDRHAEQGLDLSPQRGMQGGGDGPDESERGAAGSEPVLAPMRAEFAEARRYALEPGRPRLVERCEEPRGVETSRRHEVLRDPLLEAPGPELPGGVDGRDERVLGGQRERRAQARRVGIEQAPRLVERSRAIEVQVRVVEPAKGRNAALELPVERRGRAHPRRGESRSQPGTGTYRMSTRDPFASPSRNDASQRGQRAGYFPA